MLGFFRRYPILTPLIIVVLLAGLLVFFYPQIKHLAAPRWVEIKNSSVKRLTGLAQKGIWPFRSQNQATNFLLLGAAGTGNDAPDLTDTILVARLDPNKKKIYLFSLPRDLLVKIPGRDYFTKINALYAYAKQDTGHEFDLITQKAEEITGLPIDHYILVELTTLKQLVDILGGVNVLVKQDILDTAFPGPSHGFQTFELKAGWRYLDGETALKYIRSRHVAGGDFDRIGRQQEILQALKQKVLSLHFWDINTFVEIYQTLAAQIKSDLGLWEIKNLWQEVKDIPGDSIAKNDLTGNNLFGGGQMVLGGETASIVKPQAGVENYEEIKKFISEQINFK
ncbi:MAG TPA: hypothetical protein DHI91_01855 [Candidatus Portnoybacteria bacterium]|nr:hypothetical protein [Candidatus Portnoybacteria bacterium]